jgi:hypothetical protein
MHLKTTFLLLLVLTVVVGVIWLADRDGDSAERRPALEQKLLAIEPEKISYVSFYREGGFIECINDHGQWLLTKPMAARADSGRLNRILAVVEMLPRGETITAAQRQTRGLNFADYGLANPRARMVLGGAGKRWLLAIGNDSPMKNSVYVRIDQEDEVIATATNLLEVLPREVAEIRDPLLLPGAAAYVRRLEIKRANGPLLQLSQEGGEWVINKPVLARADWAKVAQLLEQLFFLSVRQFVADSVGDPAAYGLSDDEAVLQLGIWQADENTAERLLFGKKADEQGLAVYGMRRGTGALVTVARERLEALLAATADLRDPRLYFMAAEKMALIRLEEGEHALEFRKTGKDAWTIVEPRQWKADGRIVADLIVRLNTLRVEAVSDSTNAAAFGLERPARIIRVAEDYAALPTQAVTVATQPVPIEKQKRALLMSPPQPGQEYVWARFDGEPSIYKISAASAATISLDPLNYRDSTVLALAAATIRKITLKKDGREQIVEQVGTEGWQPKTPAGGELRRGVLTNLLARAADLKALRFERSDIRDLARYGLQDARAALTFGLASEDGLQKTLLLGDHSEDLGVYAMFQGQDLVFVLEKMLTEALTQDLVRSQ